MAEFEITRAGCLLQPTGDIYVCFFLIFHNVVVFRGIKVHLLNKVSKQFICEHRPLLGLPCLAVVIIKHGYLE